jgi:hypothetical protein
LGVDALAPKVESVHLHELQKKEVAVVSVAAAQAEAVVEPGLHQMLWQRHLQCVVKWHHQLACFYLDTCNQQHSDHFVLSASGIWTLLQILVQLLAHQ